VAVGLLGGSGVGGDALGATPLGSQFQVNTYTTSQQRYPSVAVDADGDFVVVWESEGSAGTDTDQLSIQGQRYDASGNVLGSEFQVNTYTSGAQWHPSVAADQDGDFMVVWRGPEIQAQRYDASGNAVGSQFQVNTATTGNETQPSVAMNADGESVVVWRWTPPASSNFIDIQAQRYDASGTAVGTQFQADTENTEYHSNPAVAVHADGGFVIVWETYAISGTQRHVESRRYDASGNAVGSEFQVTSPAPSGSYIVSPSVADDANGGFVVVWNYQYLLYPQSWIGAKRYDANGDPVGTAFAVNTHTYLVGDPAVAVGGKGQMLVVWDSYDGPGTDTDPRSIQGQRFSLQAPLIPSLSPPGAIGLGLLILGIAAAGLRGRLRKRA